MLWTDLLTVNGLALRVVDADTIGMEGMEPVGVVRLERALRRRDLQRVRSLKTPGLLVAASIGVRLRRDLEAADWSWIDEDAEQGVVLPLGGLVLDDEDPHVRQAPRYEPASWPRGRSAFAIVRSGTCQPFRDNYLD